MGDKVDIGMINKFDGANYAQWKFQLKCALRAKGIYGAVDGTMVKPAATGNAEEINAWNKKDAQAMFTITAAMNLNQITLIENCNSAKEIINKLDSIYQQKTETNKMLVHERFAQYKMDAKDSVAQHVAKVENLAKQIKEAGEIVSDAAIMTKILNTLPPKFRNIRQAWFSLDENRQTITNLTARLIDEEASLTALEETENAFAVFGVKSNSGNQKAGPTNSKGNGIVCYNCRKRGHMAKHCRQPKKNKSRSDSSTGPSGGQRTVHQKGSENALATSETAFNVSDSNKSHFDSESWIMDGGASAHMCHRRDFFTSFTEEHGSTVMLGNGALLEVQGRGTIKIQKLINGNWMDATINDVIYVPALKRNLLSEGQLTKRNMDIIKRDNEAKVIFKNQLVAVAVRTSSNLYKMLFKTVVYHANVASCENLKLWHERLGHINVGTLKQMVSKGLVSGINFSDTNSFFCEACCFGKQHKEPFKSRCHVKMEPGERIYSDLCGPMSTPSVQGAKYFLNFKDENSGYRVGYFVKHKSDVLDCFKVYNAKIKNKFGSAVKVLHVDNGTEYCNGEFKEYLDKEGIELETTAPYSPQQNGRAERDNRTVIESARSMLYHADLPKYLWAEAVNTAIYLLNRTPTSQTPNSTPYEIWTGQKATLDHAKVFGCEAFSHVPDQKRNKLEAKSQKLIFVGYDKNSTNYRLYNPENRKIVIARSVLFNENIGKDSHKNKKTQVAIEINYDVPEFTGETNHIENEGIENEIESNEEEEEVTAAEPVPALRPQRNIRLPTRLQEYEVNFSQFDVPDTYEEAISGEDAEKWKDAMRKESSVLKQNNTWCEVPWPKDKRVIESKWVFRKKNESEFKARLVARGFQQKCEDMNDIYAPVVKLSTFRLFIVIANKFKLPIYQMDVKSAFLYGDIKEEVYMSLPGETRINSTTVCKLNKSIYGLKKSPKCWNDKFNSLMINLGFKRSESDWCLYVKNSEKGKLYVTLYVDDVLILGNNDSDIQNLKNVLKTNFDMKDLGKISNFLGINVNQNFDVGFTELDQSDYLKRMLQKYGMSNCKAISTPIDSNFDFNLLKNEEHDANFEKVCRQIIGSLMYVVQGTRPDLCESISILSRFQTKSSEKLYIALKRVLRYVRGTLDCKLRFDTNCETLICGYVDSDWGGDVDDRKSTTGYVFKVYNCPVSWASKKQQTVSISSTEAEYIALSLAVTEACWLRKLLLDFDLFDVNKAIPIFEDNQSAIKIAYSPENSRRLKHLDIKFFFIKEKIDNGLVNVLYKRSEDQEADIFTKPLPKIKFLKFREKLGIVE